MSRANVVIDSEFPETSFWDFWKSQGPKTTKSFPLAKIETFLYRAEIFFVVTRTQSGCVFFLKYRLQKSGEGKYWSHCQKPLFSASKNFVKAAKFFWNQISKKKNTHTPIWLHYWYKNFQPDQSSRFGEKGGKLFLIMNYFRF